MSDTKQVALRLEPEFHEKITRLAKREHRSIHSQVIFILDAWFNPQALRDRLAELERHLH